MARVLRLIRLLMVMERFQLIGMISVEIVPVAVSVILVLFYVLYVFAVIGVNLYGGFITRDPDNEMAHLILDTDFSGNDYWANNFNDMTSAMNVLFNLLVVNNWTECEIGFEAVTQSRMVRYFFLAFHIIGVIFINNLVIAVIINAFLQQLAIFREKRDAEEVGGGEAIISRSSAYFDASEVTGTRTSLSGQYIARFRKKHDSGSGHNVHERLRRMFSRERSGSSDAEGPAT